MIKLLPLGGADEIGAGCFYLYLSGTGVLLDCGIHPRRKGIDALPRFELLENLPLDFVFISHAHQDHIGGLPFLVKKFPHVIIYSTIQTREIAEITLHNAVNIISSQIGDDSGLELYTHEEIDLLSRSIRFVDYNETVSLEGMRHSSVSPVNVTLFDAGHILGSAGILIEHNGHSVFYTGDINLADQVIMTKAELPKTKIDTLLLETTYGSSDSEKIGNWNAELKRLASEINKIIHKNGSVLVPVFALGKTQEMLAAIHLLMEKGILTESAIYTGGISRQISALYDHFRYTVRRMEKELVLKDIPQHNLLDIRDFNDFGKNNGIVLASSGMMLPGTTSFNLLKFWLKQKDFAVFVVGYMDEETPGFRVLNARPGAKISLSEFDEPVEIACDVKRFYFPSHSLRENLLNIVKKTEPARVVLIHGEPESRDWIGYRILNFPDPPKLFSAETAVWIELQN